MLGYKVMPINQWLSGWAASWKGKAKQIYVKVLPNADLKTLDGLMHVVSICCQNILSKLLGGWGGGARVVSAVGPPENAGGPWTTQTVALL